MYGYHFKERITSPAVGAFFKHGTASVSGITIIDVHQRKIHTSNAGVDASDVTINLI